MNPKAQKRTWYLVALLMTLTGVAFIALGALKENIVFFVTPSEWLEKPYALNTVMRLGGKVEKCSLHKKDKMITFKVTDGKNSISVSYQGIIPDLFREDQGVVAEGRFESATTFKATKILAKHDENYMPKEVADKLKEKNLWQGTSFEKKDKK